MTTRTAEHSRKVGKIQHQTGYNGRKASITALDSRRQHATPARQHDRKEESTEVSMGRHMNRKKSALDYMKQQTSACF